MCSTEQYSTVSINFNKILVFSLSDKTHLVFSNGIMRLPEVFKTGVKKRNCLIIIRAYTSLISLVNSRVTEFTFFITDIIP